MNSEIENLKNLQIISVIELIASSSMTKKAACEAQGVSISTFDRAVAESPQLVREFVLARKVLIQNRYDEYISTEDRIHKAIFEKLTDEKLKEMSVEELLFILKEISSKREKTEIQLGLIGGPDSNQGAASKLLGADVLPPIGLRKGIARVSQRETTYEVTFDNGGGSPVDQSIVEGQVLPLEQDEISQPPSEERSQS